MRICEMKRKNKIKVSHGYEKQFLLNVMESELY